MKKYMFLILFLSYKILFAQGSWTRKADFAGIQREGAVAFSIGTKGYIGTGPSLNTTGKDFWEWDQGTNIWTQKTDFGGAGRSAAIGFSIGTKGYIGLGSNDTVRGGPTAPFQDFWEWDQGNNTWTKKADFPAMSDKGAVAFSIGNKGYIVIRNELWEWDQATNVWMQKANFIGTARRWATGFSIGGKGYIGTGGDGFNFNDFWEWNQLTDTWAKKANFGGAVRGNATGFSVGNKGYIGTGVDSNFFQDFWEWDQFTDTWIQKANFGGTARGWAVGFSIGNMGYLGTGTDFDGIYWRTEKDFWEFDPTFTTGIKELQSTRGLNVSPNPTNNAVTINFSSLEKGTLYIKITNKMGEVIYSEIKNNFSGEYVNKIDLSQQPKGVYFVELILGNETKIKKIILE